MRWRFGFTAAVEVWCGMVAGVVQLSSQRAFWRCVMLGSFWCSTASAASEMADEVGHRLRVVVLSRSSDDSAFLERLHGQTVDLPIDLVSVDAAVQERGAVARLDTQVERAEALARLHTARVVAWRDSEDVVLLLVTPSSSRLLIRRIGAGPPPSSPQHVTATAPTRSGGRGRGADSDVAAISPSGSAGLEAAALIVRSALTAVLEGGTFGVLRQSSTAVAAPGPAPAPAEVAGSSPWSGVLLGDFRMASDGAGNSAPRGFGVHLGLGWNRLLAGATAMTTLDRDVGTSNAQPYWRQDVAGFIGFDLLREGRARLTAEGQGGVALFNLYRMAGTVHRVRLLLGAELRGSFDVLSSGRFRLPVWVGLGADYIPDAPPLTLTTGGPILWAVKRFQPRFMLGTGLSF